MGRLCSIVRIDNLRFAEAVDDAARQLGISARALFRRAGVSSEALSNLRRRQTSLSAAAIVSVAIHAGLDPREFLVDARKTPPLAQDPQPRESTDLEGLAVMAYIRETLYGANIHTGPRTAT